MKKNLLAVAIIALIVPFDIVTKNAIVQNFGFGERVEYLGGFLRITLVYNRGGVFGILQGYKNVFLVVSIIVLLLMVAYYIFEKNKTVVFSTSMALIFSGAIGNIIDRLIPGRPGVVDFISVGFGIYRWPAFNVADSSIVCGAFLLILWFYREEKRRRMEESGRTETEKE